MLETKEIRSLVYKHTYLLKKYVGENDTKFLSETDRKLISNLLKLSKEDQMYIRISSFFDDLSLREFNDYKIIIRHIEKNKENEENKSVRIVEIFANDSDMIDVKSYYEK